MTACRRRDDCRLCGSRELSSVLKLAPTPPANAFVKPADAGKPQEKFPLEVFLCGECGHAQLRDVVDPRLLFEHYVYVSGTSASFVRHFSEYADFLMTRFSLKRGDLIVDIGSNDGTFLRFFKEKGLKVLGVDPAHEVSAAANRAGVETLCAFFTVHEARRILDERGPAAAVTANNVFAHADDLSGMLAAVRELLAPDGIFAGEVSYLADVVEKTLFDTVYHEHLSYHAAAPLRRFLEAEGFELLEALRADSHGGSLRFCAQKKGGPGKAGASVAERLAEEKALGLSKAETFRALAGRIDRRKDELGGLLRKLKGEGRRLAGFGAPAKATTLMHHFGLGPDLLDFIVDDSPWKQGLLTPGLHVPVLAPEQLYERRPDRVLLLAWNFADAIMTKHSEFQNGGGRFIVPLPEVRLA